VKVFAGPCRWAGAESRPSVRPSTSAGRSRELSMEPHVNAKPALGRARMDGLASGAARQPQGRDSLPRRMDLTPQSYTVSVARKMVLGAKGLCGSCAAVLTFLTHSRSACTRVRPAVCNRLAGLSQLVLRTPTITRLQPAACYPPPPAYPPNKRARSARQDQANPSVDSQAWCYKYPLGLLKDKCLTLQSLNLPKCNTTHS
jgi:hypothetical protein